MSEERSQPTKNSQIFIARLHPRVSERDLKYKFEKYGDIKDIRLKPGFAFIVISSLNCIGFRKARGRRSSH